VPAAFHIRPSRGWLNDPNGMIHRDGRWHVFYQHNPAEARHTDIHWGHVSSPDLLSFEEHPVAFGPTPDGPDAGGCWSGVCVVDGDRVAAVYTGIRTSALDSTVCLRYAADTGLERWSPPVVVALQEDVPAEVGLREMRDPVFFTAAGRRWALLGGGLADGTPVLLLWSCDDLESWRFERVWLTGADPVLAAGAPAEIWECPQLVEVDGSWVLLVSLWRDNQLEGTVAAVGSMGVDAQGRPELTLRSAGRVDEGGAFYAPQVALDPDGPWLLGWVMESGAPDDAPDDAVAGCLTLPRRLSVIDDRVVSHADPRTRRLVGPVAPDAPGGDGAVPTCAHLDVEGDATLVGSQGPVVLQAGSEAWVDGDVLEVYPPDGAPVTVRHPRTSAWVVAAGGRVTVRQILSA
jgi:beta-fructofuranosidase